MNNSELERIRNTLHCEGCGRQSGVCNCDLNYKIFSWVSGIIYVGVCVFIGLIVFEVIKL